jgi:predicted ATPase
MISNFFFSTNS